MIENHQCDSSCGIQYCGSKGSMYHGKHHGYSDACGCGMSHGSSCGMSHGSSCGMSHGSSCGMSHGSSCGCGMNKGHSCGCGSADPMEQAKKLLQSAFFIALKEVHVEKIKKIIERDCGEKIDKAAELVVKEVEKHWPDSLSTSFASEEFDNELRKILTSKDM
jgi:hypothetical protein